MDALGFALLALLAFGAGVAAGRLRRGDGPPATPSRNYVQGLNFLLDDQPDRAIEAFLRAVEIDEDTVATHLALGGLLRRRGEVDKAIRIHQNLLARPELHRRTLQRVELELARDHLAAGLLGRAENLLVALSEPPAAPEVQQQARRELLEVYERERDWVAAAALARRMVHAGDAEIRRALAHYVCEQAEGALAREDHREARRLLQNALAQDARCVRALLLLGRVEYCLARPREVLRWLRRVPDLDRRFLADALDLLEGAHRELDSLRDFEAFLTRHLDGGLDVTVLRRLATIRSALGDPRPVADALLQDLARQPTLAGLEATVQEYRQHGQDVPAGALLPVVRTLLRTHDTYRCGECGFSGNLLHWQCPSCKAWGTVARALPPPRAAGGTEG